MCFLIFFKCINPSLFRSAFFPSRHGCSIMNPNIKLTVLEIMFVWFSLNASILLFRSAFFPGGLLEITLQNNSYFMMAYVQDKLMLTCNIMMSTCRLFMSTCSINISNNMLNNYVSMPYHNINIIISLISHCSLPESFTWNDVRKRYLF